MRYFDGMKKYAIEIDEENGKYILRYATFNLRDDIEVLEISKKDAEKIKNLYAPLDGLDIYKSEEGKRISKEISGEVTEILNYYYNKKHGLI